MLRWRPALAALSAICVSTALAVGTGTGTAQAAPSGTGSGTRVLTYNVFPWLSHLKVVGQPNLSQQVQVTVTLTHPNAAGEEALLHAMYTPGNPAYHHFLTPAGYAARFGVSRSTYNRVLAGVTRDGLAPVYQSPSRTLIQLAGSLSQAARTFRVSFADYRSPAGRTFFANTDAPTVPDGVQRVLGLVSLPAFTVPRTAQTLCTPAATCVGAVTPQDLWGVYDQPASDTGQGQKVAVIGAGDYKAPESDLRKFEKEFKLPQVNVVAHNVADDLTYTGGEGEWALDSEASTGMAPGVTELDYYFAEALGDADAFDAWVSDPNGPKQANASFGGCEALDMALGVPQADDPIFRQADLEGRTQFVSTGDTGGSCTVVTGNGFLNTGAPQVEYPASSPYVVGVGGTVLYTTGTTPDHRKAETGWTYTGGGTSTMEPREPWQNGVGATMVGECATNDAGTPVTGPTPCRGLPDVSAMSGDITVLSAEAGRQYAGNGYQDVEGGHDIADGGTSLASPLWMGMWTRIQAAVKPTKGGYPGAGFAAPLLYKIAYNPTEDAADFYNVAVGTNGQWRDMPRNPADPTGWSYVSGLGTPDVAHLMKTIAGRLTPANTKEHPSGTFTVDYASTAKCGANGVVENSAPAGEIDGVGPNDPSLDFREIVTAYHKSSSSLTWTATVQNLSANSNVGKAYAFAFSDGSTHSFQLLAQTDPQAGQQFELDKLSAGGTEETGSGEPTVTRITGLKGAFNVKANTIEVTLPLSLFNKHSGGAAKLVRGSKLTNMNDQSFDEMDGQGEASQELLGYNLEVSNTCPYTVK
jgi:pseudomonalisin